MAQVILKIGYRPVHVAFCIKYGDKDAFRKAVYLSHVFWGGIYTPIIAIGGIEEPLDIAARYCVDAFYAISTDADVVKFVNENNKSSWPLLSKELFIGRERIPGLLDISHSLLDISEQVAREMPKVLPIWKEDDPLADVFACFFGIIPEAKYEERDYRQPYEQLLTPHLVEISSKEVFPPLMLQFAITPRGICSYKLNSDRRYNFHSDSAVRQGGIFHGKCDDFNDLLSYWNLRAANVNAIFFDERHQNDFICWKDFFAGRTVVWTAQSQSDNQSFQDRFGLNANLRSVSEVKPLAMSFKEHTVNATSDPNNEHILHLLLPPFPHRTEVVFGRSQHVAVMIDGRLSYFDSSDHTIFTPGLPELSEYVGKKSNSFNWKSCRIHPYGTDYVQSGDNEIFSLKPWKKGEIMKQALQVCGVEAKESKPGLIANRLIKQMNGIQPCRIFKIAGVRELIKEYGAEKSFTKSVALQKIGPNLNNYDFYLPNQSTEKMTVQAVFDHLIEKGILRVGLEFECPYCNLNFWRSLDFIRSEISCDFCGDKFNVTKQLEVRDCWKYRVSGLFSQHKDQQGAIPVTVTLQHVDGCLSISCESIVTTAMELSSKQNSFPDCESDFLFLGREDDGRNFLILGECKGHKEITLDSVNKLKAVADSIPANKFRTYLLFSKFSPFTEQELEFFRSAQNADYWRIILLSNPQLERSSIYDNAPKEMGIPISVHSVDEWAAISALLYFKVTDHLDKLRNEDGTFRKRLPTVNNAADC